MMLDADIVAVSPSSVWRVLSQAGLLSKWNGMPSKMGTGLVQPLAAHQHWHIGGQRSCINLTVAPIGIAAEPYRIVFVRAGKLSLIPLSNRYLQIQLSAVR
jgi:hypothetical protein